MALCRKEANADRCRQGQFQPESAEVAVNGCWKPARSPCGGALGACSPGYLYRVLSRDTQFELAHWTHALIRMEKSATTLSRSKGGMNTELKSHALAECFPMLPDSELQELADDIKVNGLRQNIVVYEGQILDGRNRHAACRIAGVPVENRITQYQGSDPVGYVISANLKRRHLGVGARAMIAAKLATATVGGDHSTNSTNGVSVAQIAEQMNVGTTSVTIARAIQNADPKVAADVKEGRISLNEGAKRAGVAKKWKTAKKDFRPERPGSPEVPDAKVKRASTSDAEGKEVPVVDDATFKKQKLEESFWSWVDSQVDGSLAIEVALQQAFAQTDLNDLKQIVGLMDLQDLKEIVAIKELEEDAALVDVGAPSASGPEMEATSSESQQADNVIESPAVGVDTPITTPKTPKEKSSLTKEEQSDQLVENDKPEEPDQPVSIPTIKMEIPTARETVRYNRSRHRPWKHTRSAN
jgi:hypothetical protein